MDITNYNKIDFKDYLDKNELVIETANQIIKDFLLFGIKINFSGNVKTAYNDLISELVNQLSYLIDKEYQKLLSILYQIDITEKEIAQAEIEFPNYNHIEIIAHQIIVRELKKVILRRHFSKNKLE